MTTPSIPDFYDGQSVFITGATGFMGKVLVEKLLRSCPGVNRLYLLIRPSATKDPASRLEELIHGEVFESLRQHQPDVLKKLVAISGDVSLPNLGLSPSDVSALVGSVSVVFHSAARVKFDDNLRVAIDSNVKGPQKVATFCRQLRHLKAFVHVSTAYNNLHENEIVEEIYPGTLDPQKLMDLVDCMDDALLASITKQLVGSCPNVYAYTKALGEQLLEKECNSSEIPLVIVRPTIVTAAMKEPLPGYIDNLNGPSGMMVGISKGFIRTLKMDAELVGDLIPVDFAVNLMIAAAWSKATKPTQNRKDIPVYNCATGSLNPLKWKDFKRFGMEACEKYPPTETLWYPSTNMRTNQWVFRAEVALYHYLSAYVLDAVARFSGKKPFMVRLYDKAHRAMACLEFYMLREWNFVSRNPFQLLDRMSEQDRSEFNFDVRRIDWKSYIEVYGLGVRKFILKEDPNNLPEARKNQKKMLRLKTMLNVIIWSMMLLFFFFLLQRSLPSFDYDAATDTNNTFALISPVGQEGGEEVAVMAHLLAPKIPLERCIR